MTFKMTWALAAEHVDEWTGQDFTEAAAVLEREVGATVSASGMNEGGQMHFRETFLAPVRDGIPGAGREAVEAGRSWDQAAGPLLVVLAPAA
ncbi:hypothetical protein ACIRSU_25420 [Streptomyces sp. NPDC101160]|uniref:hypothetical protein n=1 Tax=Streptomyces sp. NPDC101160 TaxID=3366118 RepID=UPI0037F9FEB3